MNSLRVSDMEAEKCQYDDLWAECGLKSGVLLPKLIDVSSVIHPVQKDGRLTMFGSGKWVRGFRLWERFNEGNLIGSRIKNTGLR